MPHAPTFLMQQMLAAAIASAHPAQCVPPYLPRPEQVKGRLLVVGAGKASAAMAQAVEQAWTGDVSGLVVTRYGHEVPCQRIEIVQAAHPVPDAAGMQAAQRILQLVQGLTADDWVLCLISGGGSALLALPLPGIRLQDKQAMSRALLASGASIGEINTLRRHLSAIKGGRLAAACAPARVVNLLISDVPGDQPVDIASGPTVADPTTCADALAIAQRYGVALAPAAQQWLASGAAESIKPGDARLQRVQTHIVAAPQQALEAAARLAQAQGYRPYILSDALEGCAEDVGKLLAALALQTRQQGAAFGAFEPPCVLLSGGETTVTLGANNSGRGGRNVQCLLSLLLALRSTAGVYALMADTDGVDGTEPIAGAFITPDTLARAQAAGLSAPRSLLAHDSHGFFSALGQSVITGATRTNVNDFRVILLEKRAPFST